MNSIKNELFNITEFDFLEEQIFVKLYLPCNRIADHQSHFPLKIRGLIKYEHN